MFQTTLMSHQKAGFNKLHGLKVGALFMEMGTGKTRLYLDLAMDKINRGKAERIIILCPVSALAHTQEEVFKHMGIEATIHHGNYESPVSLVNLIGIESMSTSISAYNKLGSMIEGAILIIDESHMIKNHKALRTKHLAQIAWKASYRFLSTGTPMTNGVEDLFSQLWVLAPQILGYRDFREFQNKHLGYAFEIHGKTAVGKVVARYNTDVIANKIAPYVFQIKKTDCFNLPPKTYSFATAFMNDETEILYAEAKKRILFGQDAFEANDATIYRLLTALHMISSGIVPSFLADVCTTIESPKIIILTEQIEALPKGAKTVVFVSYLAELDAARKCLTEAGFRVFAINGSVPPAKRRDVIRKFKDDGDVLIATTATGGQSIDLSFAEYAIYLSNRFDYKDRVQSEDRIHRFGMVGNAHYIDIRMDCGIEKMIARSLQRKENAAKQFVEKIRYLRNLPEKEARTKINEQVEGL